jgi:tryptophanyl-tRNA synthetase
MSKPVILTGIRSNQEPTIGNYFGAILPLIDLAKTKSDAYDVNIFVPDLHSFTTPIDHSSLYDQTIHNLKIFAAAGLPLDNDDVHLYRQSFIPAHSELTWILDCFTGFGEMNRMTQFKDKSGKLEQDRISVGLFNYPVLMAADILMYGASYVPVGDDQTQHLEFARDIAARLNNRFADIFTIPKPVKEQHAFFGKDQGLRIMDLQDPSKKMSKSDEGGKGVIFLSDTPEAAATKVMSATTDNVGSIHFDKANQPGISNLLEILALLRGQDAQTVTAEFEGQERYGDFKKIVANAISEFLQAFQENLHNVDEAALFTKLESDESVKNIEANKTLLKAQKAVGLRK